MRYPDLGITRLIHRSIYMPYNRLTATLTATRSHNYNRPRTPSWHSYFAERSRLKVRIAKIRLAACQAIAVSTCANATKFVLVDLIVHE